MSRPIAEAGDVELCPRQDSNLRFYLRRVALYPLSYGGLLGPSPPRERTGQRMKL